MAARAAGRPAPRGNRPGRSLPVGGAAGIALADVRDYSSAPPADPPAARPPEWLKPLTIVSGLVGLLAFLAVPFLPVSQTQSSLSWPQEGSTASVRAPLMSYAPESLEATVPLAAADTLPEGEDLLVGTVPEGAERYQAQGLTVRATDTGLTVTSRGQAFFDLDREELDEAAAAGASLEVSLTADEAIARVSGFDSEILDEDLRPMSVGVFSEIPEEEAAGLIDSGLSLEQEINSRFTLSATPVKAAAIAVGLVALAVALWCLYRIDKHSSVPRARIMPAGAWRPRLLDGVVAAALAVWHLIGANTPDDGYILTMARLAGESDYMANYYRWFGVPEAPFGFPFYDLLSYMVQVSTASVWLRLPTLIAGLAIWFMLSRLVLPALGPAVAGRGVARWTAALLFLAFWLPYNNGIRPEPVIAAGALFTVVCFERAIATRRFLPAAVGVVAATLSLGAGPTGLMAVAAVLVSLPSLITLLYERLPELGAPHDGPRGRAVAASAAVLLPFFAAGTAILCGVFSTQTIATVLEATRVRSEIGPSLPWYEEFSRYEALLDVGGADGSFTRRFPVFMLLAASAIVAVSLLARRRISGVASGPTLRILLVVFGAFFFLIFTPTKWTHHFGAFAGIAPALAAVAAVALSQISVRSKPMRTFVLGGFLMIFALALAGTNGWWYISSFAVPWWDKPPQIGGVLASSVMLAISVAVLVVGVVQKFRQTLDEARVAAGEEPRPAKEPRKERPRTLGLIAAPIAVLSAITVAFSYASLAKGFVEQYPSYSVGEGNLRALAGRPCAMAEDVLVERDTNDSFLEPIGDVDLADSLDAEGNEGFGPNNIPTEISDQLGDDAEEEEPASGGSLAESDPGSNEAAVGGGTGNGTGSDSNSGTSGDSADGQSDSSAASATGETEGLRPDEGANGSRHLLPFGLDYASVPVLGSYSDDNPAPGELTSEWYALPDPAEKDNAPLVVVSAAGRIAHEDINGIEQSGTKLKLSYGKRLPGGGVRELGTATMESTGSDPSWRNLRLPLEDLPGEADAVRLVATDHLVEEKMWLAVTPPRVPELETLQDAVGTSVPVLVDWPVGLQFPCQRPYGHYAGVAEMARYRILPRHDERPALTPVQDATGGGATGLPDALATSWEVPSYLKDDWGRDWGALMAYDLRPDSTGAKPSPAEIDTREITRSGWWHPSSMPTGEEDD